MTDSPGTWRFASLTPERWPDLERLFGERGACAGCWCMWWRLTARDFEEGKGDSNRAAFKRLVDDGAEPGLLAYAEGRPVGWCAVAPREDYPRFAGSRILAPVDNRTVWSVTCLFVEPSQRRAGLSVALLQAAVEHVAARGGRLLEGYPHEKQEAAPAFVWTGLASGFRRAGFEEVARRSPTRPIMRRECKPGGR